MVEGGHESDVLRQQHAVAEHVARHVADADDGEQDEGGQETQTERQDDADSGLRSGDSDALALADAQVISGPPQKRGRRSSRPSSEREGSCGRTPGRGGAGPGTVSVDAPAHRGSHTGQRLADARPGCRGHGFEGCDGGGSTRERQGEQVHRVGDDHRRLLDRVALLRLPSGCTEGTFGQGLSGPDANGEKNQCEGDHGVTAGGLRAEATMRCDQVAPAHKRANPGHRVSRPDVPL